MNLKKENILQALSPILDEFAEWYNDLLRCLFYPELENYFQDSKVGKVFNEWAKAMERMEFVDVLSIRKASQMHDELLVLGMRLCEMAQSKQKKPEVSEFDKFSTLYFAFINNLRRLEKDSVMEDSGIDVLTGLRSKNALHEDFERELERLARRGKSFCLALARIDHYEELAAQHGRDHAREYTQAVAEFIKKSIRSFDDGYRLGSGEFLLSLKQADITGGVAALERLKKILVQGNLSIKLNDDTRALTMSCCIAEPIPGDNIEALIEHLRLDLDTAEKAAGTVLEYHEMSDLQRYIQNI